VAVTQPDGKIVVVGTSTDMGTSIRRSTEHMVRNDLAVARYNADGPFDGSFGTGGRVTTDLSIPFYTSGVAFQPDGKIVVAEDTIVARLDTDGPFDGSFGTGGRATTDFGTGSPNAVSSIAIQPDGKIVVAGSVYDTAGLTTAFAVARLNKVSGHLDRSFGVRGRVTTDFETDSGAGVAIQSDGKIVMAGSTQDPGTGWDFAVARYEGGGQDNASDDISDASGQVQPRIAITVNPTGGDSSAHEQPPRHHHGPQPGSIGRRGQRRCLRPLRGDRTDENGPLGHAQWSAGIAGLLHSEAAVSPDSDVILGGF
jgi:uncharacterized delta-60 repeat protein